MGREKGEETAWRNLMAKTLTVSCPAGLQGPQEELGALGCLHRGPAGLLLGLSKSRAEVKLKKMLCFFSENELDVECSWPVC